MHGWTTHQIWTNGRYEHYVTGRTLISNGNFWSGSILFAYAIEFSFKQLALYHCEKNCSDYKKLKLKESKRELLYKSHDLSKIYESMQELDIIDDLGNIKLILQDLYSLSKRYPSGILSSKGKGEFPSFVGTQMVPYFDDLFLQCDLQVYKKSEDPHSSCYVKALLDFKAEHLNGYNFFCSNVHIRSNLKYFTKIIREELSKNIPEYDIRKLYNPKTHNGNDIKISFHKLHLVMAPEEDESINSLKASKYKNCI